MKTNLVGTAVQRSFVLGLIWSCFSIGAFAQTPATSVDQRCSELSHLKLPDTQITMAQAIRPQPTYTLATPEGFPPAPVVVTTSFCRVAGTIAPAIRFEVWMPIEDWNGRFEGLGTGAFSGAISHGPLAQAVARGYAAGTTDGGHESDAMDARWAMKGAKLNEALVADWAHRAMHEMTVKSKAIVQAFYGKAPHHSYFVGCSSGGHQALTQAQRYPQNYDGIVAGAPANYWTHVMAGQMAYGLATRVDPASDLEAPTSKLQLIHDAVLAACDAQDGVKDGVIENPAQCGFRPATLACKGADSASCLTAPQVQALEKIYADVRTSDGRKIFPGLPPGSELAWPAMSALQVGFAESFYQYLVFQNPQWSYRTLNLDRDVAFADQRIGKIVNSINPDLSAFRARGGKLIQYHGWSDWGISPHNSVDYYESVVAQLAKGRDRATALRETQQFDRLFMVPGMGHCAGGAGPDSFDGLAVLQRWVEEGVAPTQIIAAKIADGKTVRTRPLCPYPQTAHYKGTGSTDEAANFECKA